MSVSSVKKHSWKKIFFPFLPYMIQNSEYDYTNDIFLYAVSKSTFLKFPFINIIKCSALLCSDMF